MCQRLFFDRVAGPPCNFIKKESLAQVFSCEFREIYKNSFFTEHFWETVSHNNIVLVKKLALIERDVIIPSSLRLLLKM